MPADRACLPYALRRRPRAVRANAIIEDFVVQLFRSVSPENSGETAITGSGPFRAAAPERNDNIHGGGHRVNRHGDRRWSIRMEPWAVTDSAILLLWKRRELGVGLSGVRATSREDGDYSILLLHCSNGRACHTLTGVF